MNYQVTGSKTETFENKYGMEMEELKLVGEKSCHTATQAEKAAKELYDQGADHIEIVHLAGRDHAVRYYNPREGISASGVNWAEEFKAGLEV